MHHLQEVIDMLTPIEEGHPVHVGFGIFPVKDDLQVIADHSSVKGHGMGGQMGIPFKMMVNRMDSRRQVMLVLDRTKVDRSVPAGENFCDHIGKITVQVKGVVTYDQFEFRLRFCDHQVPLGHKGLPVRFQNIDDLDRFFQFYAPGHIDEISIASPGGVQVCHGIPARCGQLSIAGIDQLRMFAGHLRQASDQHSFGELVSLKAYRMEPAVDHKKKNGVEARDVTLKGFGELKTPRVSGRYKMIIRRKEWSQRSVFVVFVFPVGNPCLHKSAESILPQKVHGLRGSSLQERLPLPVAGQEAQCQLFVVGYRTHGQSPFSILIHSYPFSSRTRASSLPADLTIRPL